MPSPVAGYAAAITYGSSASQTHESGSCVRRAYSGGGSASGQAARLSSSSFRELTAPFSSSQDEAGHGGGAVGTMSQSSRPWPSRRLQHHIDAGIDAVSRSTAARPTTPRLVILIYRHPKARYLQQSAYENSIAAFTNMVWAFYEKCGAVQWVQGQRSERSVILRS